MRVRLPSVYAPRAQRLPFQQLAHDVRCTVFRAHIVADQNAGILERSSRTRLLLEAVQTILIPGNNPQGGLLLETVSSFVNLGEFLS